MVISLLKFIVTKPSSTPPAATPWLLYGTGAHIVSSYNAVFTMFSATLRVGRPVRL